MIKCRLSRILGDRRITVRALSVMTGVTYTSLLDLYHDRSSRFDRNTIDRVCRALQCNVSDLLEYQTNPDESIGDSNKL